MQAQLLQRETGVEQLTDPPTETLLAELGASYPMLTYTGMADERDAADLPEPAPALIWPVQAPLWR
jgi:hypothetical protein